jgi:selenocysteine-specific elongation factor
MSKEELRRAVEGALAARELVSPSGGDLEDETLLLTAPGLDVLTARMRDALDEYHRRYPLRPGVPREELRSRLRLEARPFERLLQLWVARGDAREEAGCLALPGHAPAPDDAQAQRAQQILDSLKGRPFSPPAVDGDELIGYLESRGEVVALGEGIVFAAEAYREAVERVAAHLRREGSVTLAQVRDMLDTSRKYAQALLERMDQQRITRRVGDERVLRKR